MPPPRGAATPPPAIDRLRSGVVEPVTRYYDWTHATAALRSQAAGLIGTTDGGSFVAKGSGAWIGPTLFMTAAHIGVRSGDLVRMELYPEGTPAEGLDADLTYECSRPAAFAWLASNADLALWRCGTEASVAPGRRHGFLDYSLLAGQDQVGDPVYSVFGSAVATRSAASGPRNWGYTKLYAPGAITNTSASGWPAPNCRSGAESVLSPLHRTDAYGAPGAAGSPQLSAITHSVVVGPLSTAPLQGGRRRTASSMAQILSAGDLPPHESYQVETWPPVGRLYSRPRTENGCARHEGDLRGARLTDTNGNHVFDVQEAVDTALTRRPIYNLDFNAGWRRVLWTRGPAFETFTPLSSDPKTALPEPWQMHALIRAPAQDTARALTHPGLNVALDSRYLLRVEYARASAKTSLPKLGVRFVGSDGQSCSSRGRPEERLRPLRIPTEKPGREELYEPHGLYHWATFTLRPAGCSDPTLALRATGGSVYLRRVVIARQGATWSFETWDEREPWTRTGPSWRGTRYGGHALIHETPSFGPGHFSARVAVSRQGIHSPTPTALPVPADTTLTLSFRARSTSDDATAPYARFVDGNTGRTVATKTVRASRGWKKYSEEINPLPEETYLTFSVNLSPGYAGGGDGYVLDDVSLTPR